MSKNRTIAKSLTTAVAVVTTLGTSATATASMAHVAANSIGFTDVAHNSVLMLAVSIGLGAGVLFIKRVQDHFASIR